MAEQDIILLPETLRTVTAPFTGAYQTIGTPLMNGARIVKFANNSDADVTISWDGVNAHEFIPMGTFVLLDVATNKQLTSACWIRAGTQFYLSGSSGATGAFYLSVYYA